MKFKIDENLPVEIAALLQEAGYDATTILDQELDQYPGLIVLRLRRQDKPHVIRTFTGLISVFSTEPLQHRLWIVEDDKVRIRK
jgi:hypothetical protein